MSTTDAASLRGRTAVVTGGTGGIGLATATGLAARGADVIIVGRDSARGAAAVHTINAGGRATFLPADLSSQADIRRLADRISEHHTHLDILVNNVGGIYRGPQRTIDGIDRTLAVNHLAGYLLTTLLRPRLQAAPAARIVTVTTSAVRNATLTDTDLDPTGTSRGESPLKAYGRAKLINLIWLLSLSRQLQPGTVTALAADPGGASTDLTRSDVVPWIFRQLNTRLPALMSTDKAAASTINAATNPAWAGRTDLILTRAGKPSQPPATTTDHTLAAKVAALSAALTSTSA